MESVVRSVREIDAAERQVYESVLGRPLAEDQQVVIRVVSPGIVPSEERRRESLGQAESIARRGRENSAAQGMVDDEIDAAISEAIAHVRSHPAD